MTKTIIFGALAFGALLFLQIPKPSAHEATSYDECLLENIGTAQTNAILSAIRKSCRSLFPLSEEERLKQMSDRLNRWRKDYPELIDSSDCEIIYWLSEKLKEPVRSVSLKYSGEADYCPRD